MTHAIAFQRPFCLRFTTMVPSGTWRYVGVFTTAGFVSQPLYVPSACSSIGHPPPLLPSTTSRVVSHGVIGHPPRGRKCFAYSISRRFCSQTIARGLSPRAHARMHNGSLLHTQGTHRYACVCDTCLSTFYDCAPLRVCSVVLFSL